MIPDLAARVRAARAYAGLTQKQLAEAVGYDEQTVKRTEAGKRTPRDSELMATAIACDLPGLFFYVDFDRLGEIAPEPDEKDLPTGDDPYVRKEQLEAVQDSLAAAQLALTATLDEVKEQLEGIAAQIADPTRDQVSATRGVSGALKDQAADDESEHPAAADTRDEGDATAEVARAPREAKR